MASRDKSEQTRRLLACEAARMMADSGERDYAAARRKAAERTGIQDTRLWPRNSEIQEALLEHQRLFRRDQPNHLRRLRERALEAMRALARFRPRLVGPVLHGTADQGSRVRLYLYAETPEEVIHALMEQGIPWEERSVHLDYGDGARQARPALTFEAGGIGIELVVLSRRSISSPPVSRLDGRPEQGAGIGQVQALLEADTETQRLWDNGT